MPAPCKALPVLGVQGRREEEGGREIERELGRAKSSAKVLNVQR